MRWAYRRAIGAIVVTTLTDCMAFLASAVCIVPNLVGFGIFTALLAASNLVLVSSVWPCAILLHARSVERHEARLTLDPPLILPQLSGTRRA